MFAIAVGLLQLNDVVLTISHILLLDVTAVETSELTSTSRNSSNALQNFGLKVYFGKTQKHLHHRKLKLERHKNICITAKKHLQKDKDICITVS